MSTRSRTTPSLPVDCTYTACTLPGGEMNLTWAGMPDKSTESIADENPKMRRYGACNHSVMSAAFDRSGVSYTDPRDKCPGGDAIHHHVGDRCFFLQFAGNAPQGTTPNLDQLNAEAYLTMKPSLSSGFSLTNFLIELAEFKTMFKLFDRSKSLLRNTAGAYLNWQFGWKLFIKDLNEIYGKLSNMEKLLRDYKSKQGVVLVRHFKKSLETTSGEEKVATGVDIECVTKWKRKTTFHATMRYSYTIPNIDQEYAEIKAYMDVLGLRLDASIVWEAIPFSFVVDWFLSVGDYLNSKKVDYLESKVTILDYCCSYKMELEEDISVSIFHQYGLPYHNLGTRHSSQYVRKRMLPNADDFGITASHRYGTKQIVLSAALLIA